MSARLPPKPGAQLADRTLGWVMAHGRLCVWGPIVLALGCALFLPRLEAVFSPDALIGPGFTRTGPLTPPFAADEPPLIVLLEADDILSAEGIAAIHRVSTTLAAEPWCARVESITWTPLPQVVETSDSAKEVTLDDLDATPDQLAIPVDQAVGSPMAKLVAAVPARFPMGLVSAGQAMGGMGAVVARAVGGAAPTAADGARVRALMEKLPSLRGRFVSADQRAALVIGIPRTGVNEATMNRAVRGLDLAFAARPPGEASVSWSLGGLPAVRVELVDALGRDQARLVVLACLGSLAVLLFVFRSAGALGLPFATVGLCVAMVMGAMGAAGVPIDLINNVVPSLLVAIGLENAVHFVSRFQEERRGTDDPSIAALRAGRLLLLPCFLTSATTAVGFVALTISHTPAIVSFGWLAAAAVMLSYVLTFTFLPAALGRSSIGPSVPSYDPLGRLSERLGRWSVSHARSVVAVSAAVAVLCVGFAWRVRVDGGLLENLDPRSRAVSNARVLEAKLGGIRIAEVSLHAEDGWLSPARMASLEDLTRWLHAQDGVLDIMGPSDFLRDGWGLVTGGAASAREPWVNGAQLMALADLVGHELDGGVLSRDGRDARLRVRFADVGSARIAESIDRMEAHLASLPRTPYALYGEAYRASNGLRAVVHDLTSSLAFATVVIFALLFVAYRSWRLAAVSVPPNILPLLMTLGYMGARGIPLHAATSIVFVVTVGIMVNGTIHVLARFGGSVHEDLATRISVAAELSGRAVVTTAATLLVGFVALLGSSFLPIRLFGELSVVAIGSALVCNYTLLPALLFLGIPPGPTHTTTP